MPFSAAPGGRGLPEALQPDCGAGQGPGAGLRPPAHHRCHLHDRQGGPFSPEEGATGR